MHNGEMTIDPHVAAFVSEHNIGSLATLKRDGRPQLSNISYTFDAESGLVRMSLTDDRAKVKNLRRDPRASLLVQAPAGGRTPSRGRHDADRGGRPPDDATSDELVDVYRAVAGKDHPDWDEYRAAMIADKRLVGRLQVTHAYGLPSR